MAQMFRIDLTSIPTQEERFDIVVLLEKSGFLVSIGDRSTNVTRSSIMLMRFGLNSPSQFFLIYLMQ